MTGSNPEWLPHFSNEIVAGVRKTQQCAYSIALEGWRRGLRLKWYSIDSSKFSNFITSGDDPYGRLFSLSSKERTHYFFRTRGDKVQNEAVKIGIDKVETKIRLKQAGVPVPRGQKFEIEVDDGDIIAYASEDIGYPVVLKPVDGSMGKGVFTNIKNEEELTRALRHIREAFNFKELIIEQHISGEEYRVYVVDGKVIGAYNRLPANVFGDGISTIRELINYKNKERRENPRLISSPIKIDDDLLEYLQTNKYSLDYIPRKGERVFLRGKSNISSGGDPVDATDILPEKIKQTAIDAIEAIPGLYHGGVDIIWDKNKMDTKQPAVVIELNPTAQIGGILFPIEGSARDIPASIIDFYFPETINKKKTDMYFDFHGILKPLRNRSAIEVEVEPAPKGEVYAMKYRVRCFRNESTYLNWLKKEAFDRHLHGYAKKLKKGDLEIVVAGTNKETVCGFKNIISRSHNKAEISEVFEEVWKKPVKIGFEIVNQFKISTEDVDQKLEEIKSKKNKLLREKKYIEKQYKKIQRSTLWRLSWPFRKMVGLYKFLSTNNK